MSQKIFHSFHGNKLIRTKEQLFKHIKNTFTIEFWANPAGIHGIGRESLIGSSPQFWSGQFAIAPVLGSYRDGDSSRAAVGVSVGTNGVSVYEHTTNYSPSILVWPTSIKGWTHIAVVYTDKTPTLYINGIFAKTGLTSHKRVIVPSGIFGGMQNTSLYHGGLRDIRIWTVARSQAEIQQDLNQDLKGNEAGLFGNWKLNEAAGRTAYDSSMNKNNGTIELINEKTNIKDSKIEAVKSNIKKTDNSAKGENKIVKNMGWKRFKKADAPSSKRKNILFTFFVPSGGVETLNRQRFYALNKAGINCHFLYSQSGTGLQNKINTPIFITKDDNKIKDIISKGNYQAIIVGSDLVMVEKLRKLGYRGIIIYEIQGLGYNKEYADTFLKKHAQPILNSHCDAILYPQTPHLIQAFKANFPWKTQFSFHNCFNVEEFNYKQYPKRNGPIIGWVGRLEENKNWRDFLLIGARLIQHNPSIQLWMFEDNTLSTAKERQAFEKKMDELNIRKHVKVFANQPHNKMAEHFSVIGDSGGFLCSTSKVEGFGYAVLEAMVCRCPVLSTDSDGVRSFIKHNITGKFFELGNINQAVNQGKDLLSNMHLRESIRQKAVQHIETNFSPDKYANNFLSMIKTIKNVKK